jgi:hypothetical protein
MRSCRYVPYNGCATIRQRRSGIGGASCGVSHSTIFETVSEAGWPRHRGSERSQPITTTSNPQEIANGSDQETTSRPVTVEGELPRLERLGLRSGESPGIRWAGITQGLSKPRRISRSPRLSNLLGSQAQQRPVSPGVNPSNARIQGLHYHANALADGRNGERNSSHQQHQARRNDTCGNPESEHQDDKKRRECQHIPLPPF